MNNRRTTFLNLKITFLLASLLACTLCLEKVSLASPAEQDSTLLNMEGRTPAFHSNAIILDFDGDRQPDLITTRVEINSYSVEIFLSSRREFVSLNFSSREPGLGLFVFDIDGDNDQDLLIADPASLKPLAVWINDGQGHFERNDHGLKTSFLLNRTGREYGREAPAGDHLLINNDERFSVDRLSLFSQTEPKIETVIPRTHDAPALQIIARKLSSRSPPLSTPLI